MTAGVRARRDALRSAWFLLPAVASLAVFGAAARAQTPGLPVPGIGSPRPGPDLAKDLERQLLPDSLRALLEEEQTEKETPAARDSAAAEGEPEPPPGTRPPETVEPPPPEEEPGPLELQHFGRSLFARAPETFVPPTNISVGPNYIVGPADELIISVWGQTDLNYTVVVTREGDIVLPEAGLIHVAGRSMSEVEELLRRQLERFYSGIQVNVATGRLRTVTVFVIGDVERPGAYTVSSLATVFNALYAAGGPTESGSLRRVRLARRDGQAMVIDFYRYLLQGDNAVDQRVEDGATIFVPPLGATVSVRGAILRPAIYELEGTETLAEVLEMAGGTEATAYLGRISVERVSEGRAMRLLDVLPDGEGDAGLDLPMRNGDNVTVFEVLSERVNQLEIDGEVKRPGEYEYREGMRFLDLLRAAEGVEGEAYLERAEIERTNPDRSREIIPVRLGDALRGDASQNPPLQPLDFIHIYSGPDALAPDSVLISGNVRQPGQYALTAGMTLSDLVFQAGGLLESAYLQRADVARVRPREGVPGGGETDMLFVSLADYVAGHRKVPFLLQRGDRVYIRQIPDWAEPGEVELLGEVRFPGRYPLIGPAQTLSDIIERAGGLTPKSFLPGVVFERADAGRVIVDVQRLLEKKDEREDIRLHPGDRIVIPPTPETVAVRGAVYLPGSIKFVPGKKAGYYIEKCGGYVEDADLNEVRIVQPDGSVERPRTWRPDPEVEAGAVVEVPVKAPSDTNWGEIVTVTAQTLASVSAFLFFTLEILRR